MNGSPAFGGELPAQLMCCITYKKSNELPTYHALLLPHSAPLMAAGAHALVFPFPAQSHVISLLELSYCLLDRGFKVTFLNTEFNHGRLLAALPKEHACEAASEKPQISGGVRLVSIPDGLGPDENRNDLGRLIERMMEVMPEWIEEFVANGEERFTCFVVDQCMAWALNVAKKAGLRTAAIFPASAAVLAQNMSIPKLIADGVINEEGEVKKEEVFRLSPETPAMDPAQLTWNCSKDAKTKKTIFHYFADNNEAVPNADLLLCNTFRELEKPVFAYAPHILPVGPLLTGSRPDKATGNFWAQDTDCIRWLDEQPNNSVIYVAFGSFTVFDQHQFQELAAGLELTGRHFLWVVRPDLVELNSSSQVNSVRGWTVGWCPQQRVLAHPSIACFVSHCGWNSILEGVRNGVPFLCWPYFGDQFLNQSYVCDVWRIGLRMAADEDMVYSREEIRSKVEELIRDEGIKERSLALKEMARESGEEGGHSFDNFNRFVDLMKGI